MGTTEQYLGWRYIGKSPSAHYCVSVGRDEVITKCGMHRYKDAVIRGTPGVTARRCKRCEKQP